MALHQQPSDGREYHGAHLHVEFTPPYRNATKLKFLAGSETAAGVFINDVRAEEAAAELRAAIPET
jgi:UDPglucose--hexose-1-phosphate uridylyltransferase